MNFIDIFYLILIFIVIKTIFNWMFKKPPLGGFYYGYPLPSQGPDRSMNQGGHMIY